MTNKPSPKPIYFFDRSLIKRLGLSMLFSTVLFISCIIFFIIYLFIKSPGDPEAFIDINGKKLPGSISEKVFVNINGLKQGMYITSKDTTKPVLLFLHGGPGMPEYFLTEKYPTGLEDLFTICWWEQRGSGISFSSDISPNTMTIKQLIDDTHEVTRYLRQRFGREKIYLMAHSFGSYLGIQAASAAPELYYAYIGIGQVAYQLKSEKLAYDYMLNQYRKHQNIDMYYKLLKSPVTMERGMPDSYLSIRDEIMHEMAIGTTMNMKSVVTGIFLPSLFTPVYSVPEKINLWRGKAFSRKYLWNDFINTDLTSKVNKLTIPVYIFHGLFDYTASFKLSKEYFEKIEAPVKGFYIYEHSAHSPLFEQPKKMAMILEEDVLKGKNNLADVK